MLEEEKKMVELPRLGEEKTDILKLNASALAKAMCFKDRSMFFERIKENFCFFVSRYGSSVIIISVIKKCVGCLIKVDQSEIQKSEKISSFIKSNKLNNVGFLFMIIEEENMLAQVVNNVRIGIEPSEEEALLVVTELASLALVNTCLSNSDCCLLKQKLHSLLCVAVDTLNRVCEEEIAIDDSLLKRVILLDALCETHLIEVQEKTHPLSLLSQRQLPSLSPEISVEESAASQPSQAIQPIQLTEENEENEAGLKNFPASSANIFFKSPEVLAAQQVRVLRDVVDGAQPSPRGCCRLC